MKSHSAIKRGEKEGNSTRFRKRGVSVSGRGTHQGEGLLCKKRDRHQECTRGNLNSSYNSGATKRIKKTKRAKRQPGDYLIRKN